MKKLGPIKRIFNKIFRIDSSQIGMVGDNNKVEGGIHLHTHHPDDKSKADPAAMKNAYLNHLFCDSGILTLDGVDPNAASCEADSKLNLGAVYTALLTHDAEDFQDGMNKGRMEEKRRRSVIEVLNLNRHVVLLGDPGSGKTTFVNFAACCMAGEMLKSDEVNLELLTCPLPDDDEEEKEAENQKWDHGALLPVRVILRDFAARGMVEGEGSASDLWRFIEDELKTAEMGDYAPFLKKELRENGGILLLDGLDEVPEADERRVVIRGIVEDFIRSFGQCRVLVTSRTYAYQKQDWRISGLYEAVLARFTDGQIRSFIDRWYAHVAELRHKDMNEAQGNAKLLKHAVFTNDRLKELAERPLLLTLMASLHSWRGGTLPENREALYADTVDLLLNWWERPKMVKDREGNVSLAQPSLMEWLRIDRTQMRRMLNELAFEVHSKQAELTGTADIKESQLVQGLWDLCKNPEANPVKLVEYLCDRAGLLLPRGVKVYSFPHRTFQEYLAACHLTDFDYPDQVAEFCREEPDRWREVCLLAGAKAARGSSSSIWALAEALCYNDLGDGDPDSADLWGALLAGQSLTETAILDKISPRNEVKLERVKKWLLFILEGDQLPAIERAAAGNALSCLGDPRFDPENYYLPVGEDMGFVTVPAGEFLMGSTEEQVEEWRPSLPEGLESFFDSEIPQHKVELSTYQILKYPVTVHQFKIFAEETEFQLDGTWHQWNKVDNHPVVHVSWNDAIAFCEWLSAKFEGKNLRAALPTEAQWEKAARGFDGNLYPWGNEKIDAEKANYTETGIGATSPVGCFTKGKSPHGAQDMIGNVLEWCADYCDVDSDKYFVVTDTYIEGIKDPLSKEGSGRVLRGGSWRGTAQVCRSAFRFRNGPDYRNLLIGFRLVLLPGQQDQTS